jgi:hypothetical protein
MLNIRNQLFMNAAAMISRPTRMFTGIMVVLAGKGRLSQK